MKKSVADIEAKVTEYRLATIEQQEAKEKARKNSIKTSAESKIDSIVAQLIKDTLPRQEC